MKSATGIVWTGYIRIVITTENQTGGNVVLKPNEAEYIVLSNAYDIEYESIEVSVPRFDVPEVPQQDFNIASLKPAALYQMYDELIEQSNGYITKRVLGKDASGLYDLWRISLRNSTSPAPCKVIIVAQVHGMGNIASDDYDASFNVFYLTKFLTEKMNDTATYIRENVDFEIIPIGNPWGMDNGSYGNYNNIQLAINYDVNFKPNVNTAGGASTGATPFSEPESQYIRDMLHENMDADLFIDQHSYGRANGYKVTYQSSDCNNNNLWYGLVKIMEDTAKRIQGVQNKFIIPTNNDIPGGFSVDYANLVCGIPAAILECGSVTGHTLYGKEHLTSNLMNLVGLIQLITDSKLKKIRKKNSPDFSEKYFR